MKKNNLQDYTLEDSHLYLFQFFTKGFTQVYRQMESEKREGLLTLAPVLFQKWYSSTLVTETILSPAYIIAADKRVSLSEGETACYQLIADDECKNPPLFHYQLQIYSIQNHPLITDVKMILRYCQPDISTNEDGGFTKEDASILLKRLSLQDSQYLDYLTKLCWSMGFFAKLPSIYSARMQSTDFDNFLGLPAAQQLHMLLKGALVLTTEQLQNALHIDWDFITMDFFKPYLESALDVDKIFMDMFQMLDIEIEAVWERATKGLLTPDDASIMSSFYYMGILLDKWFLTPMSFYFQIIQPHYFNSFSFINTINNLASLLTMQSDISMELYSSCSYYRQTPLGYALLGSTEDVQSNYNVPTHLTFDKLMTSINLEEREQQNLAKRKKSQQEKIVYTFKVKFALQKIKWKIIEVFADADLEHFCDELCAAFSFEDVCDYTLTTWDHNQFPMEFSPEESKRAVNKAHSKTLDSLLLGVGDKMVFTPMPDKNKQLELTLTKISAGNPFIVYPRIKKQSTQITQAEKMEDLF